MITKRKETLHVRHLHCNSLVFWSLMLRRVLRSFAQVRLEYACSNLPRQEDSESCVIFKWRMALVVFKPWQSSSHIACIRAQLEVDNGTAPDSASCLSFLVFRLMPNGTCSGV